MKKIIIALILVAGVGALAYQSVENVALSKVERDQATILLAGLGGGGDTGGVGTTDFSSSKNLNTGSDLITSQKTKKPGCRNTLACNYDSAATTDGGTCEYAFWSVPKSTSPGDLFPDKFESNSNAEISFFNELAFMEINASIDNNDDSVVIQPKKGVCTKTGCTNISIVRMSGVASDFPNPDVFLGSFTSSVEPQGFVSNRVAEFVTGMKACDYVKKPVNPKTPPKNSKVR